MSNVPLTALKTPSDHINSERCGAHRVVPVGGVMLHFDDSSSDRSGVQWFRDPRCKVSYSRLYLDDGRVVQITPSMAQAAWHAGCCKQKNANSHFYGLAIAAKDGDVVQPQQLGALVADVVAIFRDHHWSGNDVAQRLVGHEDQAVFNERDNPTMPEKWGQLGRKIDPTGTKPARPVLDTNHVRQLVAATLGGL